MSPRPGIGLYREISSLGLNSSLNFINASLYCLRIDLYVSPSVNTLFYPFSSCFMRIARLPFDEDLVTETFLLRFAISEFYHCLGMKLLFTLVVRALIPFYTFYIRIKHHQTKLARLVQSTKISVSALAFGKL